MRYNISYKISYTLFIIETNENFYLAEIQTNLLYPVNIEAHVLFMMVLLGHFDEKTLSKGSLRRLK